eukprot:SAG22_NODE_715_length_7716_cov_9.535513_1_plen_72_part_10
MADEQTDWMHPDELRELKLKDLRARAVAAGIDADELEAARDDDQPKEAIIALLLKAEAAAEASADAAAAAAA